MDQQKKSNVNEPMQADFAAMPLEDKIKNLMKMEVVTLGETFSYVVKSGIEVVEKVGQTIEQFGTKVETEARKAANTTAEPKAKTEDKKPKAGKKSSKPKT